MFIQINSEQFKVQNLFKNQNTYTVRISNDIADNFYEVLSNNESLTIQDNDVSYVIEGYSIETPVVGDKFIDYTISPITKATVITKADLDSISQQITNLELALCEIYESQGV